MFKVTIAEHEYAFYFGHDTDCIQHKENNILVRVTRCFVEIDKERKPDLVGAAFCSPHDNFQKSAGRKIALTRLLELLHFTKEEKTLVWEEYFRHTKKEK